MRTELEFERFKQVMMDSLYQERNRLRAELIQFGGDRKLSPEEDKEKDRLNDCLQEVVADFHKYEDLTYEQWRRDHISSDQDERRKDRL